MNRKKAIIAILAAAISVQSAVPAYAATNSKEEVVYVMTDASGDTESVNVVNIFGKGSVTDYGNYSSVRMMNTTDDITLDGDKITFTTDKDRVYYEGTLKNTVLPWNITFKYKLDGKEISPDDLPGKSGKLEISLNISENSEAEGDYFDNYALQVSMSLDTDKCENIVAENATCANSGTNKQLSYIVLPNKGLDATITADVTDFEMDAVSINGVRMQIDVDVDDDELMDQVQDIMDAATDINDGVNDLGDGITTFTDSVNALDNAMSKLNNASDTLNTASDKVADGISSAADGASKLESAATYSAYKQALKDKGLDIDQVTSGNEEAISTLSSQISQLQASLHEIKSVEGYESDSTLMTQAKTLESQISSLTSTLALLKGNSAALSATENYFDTLSSGASELSDGLDTLSDSYLSFDSGLSSYTSSVAKVKQATSKLSDGSSELTDGSSKLIDGTKKFKDETSDMDIQVEDKIDDMLSSITGDEDADVTSFVSDKNDNVTSVQFVIKTAAIEIPEDDDEDDVTDDTKTGFIDKLLALFGI